MKARKIVDQVYWLGAVDWDRRLFDALVPLPDGTSYNAYLVRGSEKTALLDTVEPLMADKLMAQLEEVTHLEYIIAHHAEQDHAGAIPKVIERFPQAKILATPKGKAMLVDHLRIDSDRLIEVSDGETVSLGDKTLEFIHAPWVHWPETMSTYLREDKILFSCDFFGSHLATNDLFVSDEGRVYEAAKRYYAELMMPFRGVVQRNLEKIKSRQLRFIAPSHGPIYPKPAFIFDAYMDWVASPPRNSVVLPYVSMHGSTRKMVEYLVSALTEQGVTVHQFDLAVTDIGKLAMALVDAATIVIGTPTVHVGPHPLAFYAAYMANALRPKLKYAAIIGSYGWSTKTAEQIAGLIPNLKVELLPPVLCKGYPQPEDFLALDGLAAAIVEKHRADQLV